MFTTTASFQNVMHLLVIYTARCYVCLLTLCNCMDLPEKPMFDELVRKFVSFNNIFCFIPDISHVRKKNMLQELYNLSTVRYFWSIDYPLTTKALLLWGVKQRWRKIVFNRSLLHRSKTTIIYVCQQKRLRIALILNMF